MSESDADEYWEPQKFVCPDGWQEVEFDQAFETVSTRGRTIKQSSYSRSGRFPIIDQGQEQIAGYTDDESLVIDPGDGLLVFGDHTRCVKHVRQPFAPGADGTKILRPKGMTSEFAHHLCSAIRLPSRGYSRHFRYLRRVALPVPESLETQRKVVDKINQLFSRIDEGERALHRVETLVERYRQSVIKAAVTGELTRDWRAANRERLEAEGDTGQALLDRILTARRQAWEAAELDKLTAKGKPPKTDAWKAKYKPPAAPDTDGLPELPEGWVWASLEQISSAEAPIAYGVLQPGPDIEHGVPMVRVCDMQATRTKLDGLKRIAPDIAAKYPRTELQGGELLISVVGTIGRISIASEELAGANVARAVSVIRLVEADLIEWAVLALDNLKSNQRLVAAAREVARKTLNLEQLRSFAVPVPPIGEAAQATMIFSEKLAELDASHRAVLAASNRSAAIKSAVLSAAFSGRLITENM